MQDLVIQTENCVVSNILLPSCIISATIAPSVKKIEYSNSKFIDFFGKRHNLNFIVDLFEKNKRYEVEQCLSISSPDISSVIEGCLVDDKVWTVHFSVLQSDRIMLQFIQQFLDYSKAPSNSVLDVSGFGNSFLDDHTSVVDFLENAPRPMHVVDQDLKIIWANKIELEILGYKPSEYIGHHLYEFTPDNQYYQKSHSSWAPGKFGDNFDLYVEFVAKNKSIHIMRVVANRNESPNKTWTSRSIMHDNTEALELEKTKEEKRKLMENMLEIKRSFVRYISHEIRSPLNVLYGGLQLLLCNATVISYQELHEVVTDLFTSTSQAIDILNDVLHFEKFEAGKFEMIPTEIPLYNWDVSLQCRPLENFAKAQNVKFEILWPPVNNSQNGDVGNDDNNNMINRLCLHADIIRIYQVIRNLVTNAIKFSDEGQQVTLSFEILPYDGSVVGAVASLRSTVTDNGPGISLENQKFLFTQFSQFDQNILQGGGGSGLGLWISKAIVDSHNGEMSFYSSGKGASFFFTFPLFELAANTKRQRNDDLNDNISSKLKSNESKDDQNQAMKGSTIRPCHYLLVDDSDLNRKMLTRLLHVIDPTCQIDEANDGSTAIQLFESVEGRYDCIFLDFVMNTLHGPATAEVLRTKYGYAGIIVGVTGNVLTEDMATFIKSGANEVMVKPVSKDILEDLLKQFSLLF
eukprot:gene14077-18889_t